MKQMKKYIYAFFICGSLLVTNSVARSAEITAVDFSGNPIGQVISNGMVISADGNNVGYITADSLIMNNQNVLIGGVAPQGIAIGMDNRLLGKIHSDGVVRDLSGKIVGKTLPNGLIVDDNANILGATLYPGLVYSVSGNTIGRITGSGIYMNLDGQEIGFVSANGYAYRKSGEEYVLDGRLMSSKMVASLEGKFMGSIAPSGRVIDFEGKEIGNIHANGYVYDNADQIIGGVVKSGYAFDVSGRYMGVVSYNGEILDGERVIGMYRPDGNIVDENNNVIGFAVSMQTVVNDNNGRYLGTLTPSGNIMKGAEIVGHLGAKGKVYNQADEMIGEVAYTGPIFDVLAHLKGMAMPNGTVVSVTGSPIGHMEGRYAFDTNGTLIGAVAADMVAVDRNNKQLGSTNINATVKNGSELGRVSPFGYLLNAENRQIGRSLTLNPIYGTEGILYSYITPNGSLYRMVDDVKLTGDGVLLNKNGFVGKMLDPLYALGFNGNNLGKFTQRNVLTGKDGDIVDKLVPGGYVIESKGGVGQNLAPIVGFSSDKRIALSISGDLIGYAQSDGKVKDLNGQEYGKVIYNNYVVDNNQVVVGQLVPFTGVYNEKCTTLGVVNGRGDVINNRDVLIGRILPNGQAISDVGSYIAYSYENHGLIDFDGNYSGIISVGQGMDYSGKALGCVNRQGMIVDGDNRVRYGVITPEPVINFDDEIIGHVLESGQVVSPQSGIIGYMQPNGNVVEKSKKVLGNVMRYKVAYDNDNKFLGMVQNSGDVVNTKGEVVGKVNFDGSVQYGSDIVGYALYDFYVYDENFVTYGYLTKDGTVLSVVGSKLGTMDKGFVLNRKNEIVARGNRDYIVRSVNNEAVGELKLDGNVVDFDGNNVGYLSEAGAIRNAGGEEIARATPLQYYVVSEYEEEDQRVSRPQVQIVENEGDGKKTGKTKSDKNIKPVQGSSQIIGIAISPEGDVIGNIFDDDTVRDDSGAQIGFVTPDGVVVDMNYNPIGVKEKTIGDVGQIFIPTSEVGLGKAYGIGKKPGGAGGDGSGVEELDPRTQAAIYNMQQQRRAASGPLEQREINTAVFTGYEKDGWPGANKNISSWRVDMSEMILEDKPIPAVLARSVYAEEGFSSNIPITAIVERNVYAEEGRNIIIPAGSRVIGSAGDSGGSGGNTGSAVKIGISWKRLIRPDGSQFLFSSAQTADAQGRAGAIGYLDEQLLKRYSLPLLTTALQSSLNFVMASGNGTTNDFNSGYSTSSSRSQAADNARENFNDQMNRIFEDIIERKAKIKSVTYVPAGTRIIIFPNEDLWLNSYQRDSEKQENDGTGGSVKVDEPDRLLDPDPKPLEATVSSGGTAAPVGAPSGPQIYQPQQTRPVNNPAGSQQVYPPTSTSSKTLSNEKSPDDDKIDLM